MANNEPAQGLKPKAPRSPRTTKRGELREKRVSKILDADGNIVPAAESGSERKCVLSGEHGPRDGLIRLALGPDGQIAPDVRARAGGRGAWIGVDRPTLEAAIAKGKLKGALARAFRTSEFTIPADLPEKIEAALQRAALDRLGLESRSGTILIGTDRITDAARRGTISLLLHAKDASIDGNRKLDQALRVGLDQEGSGKRGMIIPANRDTLSMALGRENVVHAAVIAPAAAERVSDALGRWRGFIGCDEKADPCESDSQGPSAQQM